MADWAFLEESSDGVVLHVRVQPGARRTGLAGTGGGWLRLRVAAPPVQGRANETARGYLAELLGLPASAVVLVGGAAARTKRFLLRGAEARAVRQRLERALGREGF